MLKIETAFKSSGMTPTILLHIYRAGFFFSLLGFTIICKYFHSPVHASVSYPVYGAHAFYGAQCHSKD